MNKRFLAAGLLFVYAVLLRTWGITSFFWMLGDQTRDWSVALQGWRDLPLGGVPSNAGGTTLGPAYYWILWGIRHAVGPFTDNLPHAGGIGLSIIHSAADALLFLGLWKRSGSLWLALGVSLLLVSQPHDMALIAAISNAPTAVAFAKIAIAIVLFAADDSSLWPSVAITIAAWIAVQSHSSAIFVSVPAIAALPFADAARCRWRSAVRRLRASFDVILLMQVPLLINLMNAPAQSVAPGKVVSSVVYTLHHPAALHLAQTYRQVAGACSFLLLAPWTPAWFGIALLFCLAATAFRLRGDLALLTIAVAPPLLFVAGFALYQQPLDTYYCMPIVPSVALVVAYAITAWKPAARPISIALTAAVLLWQPARRADSLLYYRDPGYGPLLRGSREIRRRTSEIRFLETEFRVLPTVDANYLYVTLGGRFTADAPYSAVINSNGDVRFVPLKP